MTSNKPFSPVSVPALYSRSSGSSIAARRFVNIVPVRASLAVPQTRGEAGHGTNGSGVRAPASTHRCHLLLTLGEPLERDWLVASPRPPPPVLVVTIPPIVPASYLAHGPPPGVWGG